MAILSVSGKAKHIHLFPQYLTRKFGKDTPVTEVARILKKNPELLRAGEVTFKTKCTV